MRIVLEHCDYEKIAQEIANGSWDGKNSFFYSTLQLEVDYYVETVVERDDDYFNGTGYWNVKHVEVSIDNITCEDDIEVEYDNRDIERLAENMIRQ